MAYSAANLTLLSQANGYGYYRYDTLDTHATVDTAAYFTGESINMLKVGDIIDVIVWATAVRTGTISTYGRHIVNSSTGSAVDVSDVTVGTVTDTD